MSSSVDEASVTCEYCAPPGEQSVGWTPLSYQHLLTIEHTVMSKLEDTAPGARRLDRWLFGVRLFKSRSAAADAVSGGKVHLNGERVKPSHDIKPGDNVTFSRGAVVFECVVVAVPRRRGPASEAAPCYEETLASKARGEEFAARMKVAAGLTPRPDERPNKRDRRMLRQLRGRN
jgi:ribosome-associated heat shock protein Hsp15